MNDIARRPHAIMTEHHFSRVHLSDRFWTGKLNILATTGIDVQRQRLEETHCIDNFRIIGGLKSHAFRVGFFYSDSDLYKWVEGACRILQLQPNAVLAREVDEIIATIRAAQQTDGYIHTYDTYFFPGRRWQYLQVMHQLYCAGHLIEAAIARNELGKEDLLEVVIKLADLIVRDFASKGPEGTDGHEEIAIALIQLYHVTGKRDYFELAQHFVEQRGRLRRPGLQLMKDFRGWGRDNKIIAQQQVKFEQRENTRVPSILYRDPFTSHKDVKTVLRAIQTFLSGQYNQQHMPARAQREVVGHAVRQTYYATEMGDLYLETGEADLRHTLEVMWENMVSRRMYITGGVGSRGITEAFGKDYELPNQNSYSETCAAIGSMLWAWRMTLATGDAQYADVFERQLYNAFLVGMGVDGRTWMYQNPLECRGGISRAAWFKTPCCPPNMARMLPSLGGYIYGIMPDAIWIHQYIGNNSTLAMSRNNIINVGIESELPWGGIVRIHIDPPNAIAFSLHIRIPTWTSHFKMDLNGESMPTLEGKGARYITLHRLWIPGDLLTVNFQCTPVFVESHLKVKNNRGKVAIMRGPLVYCFEGADNPEIDLFHTCLRRDQNLRDEVRPDLLGGISIIKGATREGSEVIAIPFYAWANRDLGPMRIWMPAK